jgi:ATP-dependent DNA helicase RecG
METMVSTDDGFKYRSRPQTGPENMGTQQSGVLNLQIADIVRDRDILACQKPRHKNTERRCSSTKARTCYPRAVYIRID